VYSDRTGGETAPRARLDAVRTETIRMFGAEKADAPSIPWAEVEGRLRDAITYWLVVDGSRARPVWGSWHEDALWLSVGSTTLWHGLQSSPDASVHLGDGHDVVIVEGTQRTETDRDALDRFCGPYNEKYRWDFTPENAGGIVVLAPRVVLAWKAGSYETAKDDTYPLAAARFVPD
jgi:hypothetical protein